MASADSPTTRGPDHASRSMTLPLHEGIATSDAPAPRTASRSIRATAVGSVAETPGLTGRIHP